MLKTIFSALVGLWLGLVLLLLAMLFIDKYYSAATWYSLDKVYIEDAKVGAPIQMAVDRTILKEFDGRYVVTIRRLPDFEPVCSGGTRVNYNTKSTLPDPLTLRWWTFGAVPECMGQMTPGHYEAETCIYIEPHLLWLPARGLCRKSNIFEVKA